MAVDAVAGLLLVRFVVHRHGGVAELATELQQRDRARLAGGGAQRDLIAEDVVAHDLLFADGRRDDPPFLGEAFARLHIELVLVAQTAHEATAGAGDLGGVECREALILGRARLDRTELGEPGGRAELAAAPSDAVEPTGLVAHADVPHVHAGGETLLELAHQLAEIDALLGCEVAGEPAAIPLPFGVADLHVEVQLAHDLERGLAYRFLVDAQPHGGVDLVRGREANDPGQLGG